MPRYYCDYCDTYLTHDSQAGRMQHIRGWKHRENVKIYYEQFLPPGTNLNLPPGMTGPPRPPFPPRGPMGRPPPGMLRPPPPPQGFVPLGGVSGVNVPPRPPPGMMPPAIRGPPGGHYGPPT